MAKREIQKIGVFIVFSDLRSTVVSNAIMYRLISLYLLRMRTRSMVGIIVVVLCVPGYSCFEDE